MALVIAHACCHENKRRKPVTDIMKYCRFTMWLFIELENIYLRTSFTTRMLFVAPIAFCDAFFFCARPFNETTMIPIECLLIWCLTVAEHDPAWTWTYIRENICISLYHHFPFFCICCKSYICHERNWKYWNSTTNRKWMIKNERLTKKNANKYKLLIRANRDDFEYSKCFRITLRYPKSGAVWYTGQYMNGSFYLMVEMDFIEIIIIKKNTIVNLHN